MFLCRGENSDSIELLARLPTWGGPASYLTTVAVYTDRLTVTEFLHVSSV